MRLVLEVPRVKPPGHREHGHAKLSERDLKDTKSTMEELGSGN
jgi:hypothetical protein